MWHEVSVLQPEDLDLEYVNCHPKTGFLPYVDVHETPDRVTGKSRITVPSDTA
ncbi:phenylacetaldoxime dehydratase family protein [Salicibibacter kimchii]|uniref:phenylacetaldoxime dehydratase family protein n=1 Tax=Salicibibacter kimchii TaxID=2099786 RepID=UPI0013582287|nr:phenylacetaldoxime dehydratase family protein [Salicibibacter kimchii]